MTTERLHDTNPDNARKRLLRLLLAEKDVEQREALFYKADHISTWYHSLSGRFFHLVLCIETLAVPNRKMVLRFLGMQEETFEWAVKNSSNSFNLPAAFQHHVISTAEGLFTKIFTFAPHGSCTDSSSIPSSMAPYSECQVRNLVLSATVEGRERSYQHISSVTRAVASTVHAYQKLCLAVNSLHDAQMIEDTLHLMGMEYEKYRKALQLLEPFYAVETEGAC